MSVYDPDNFAGRVNHAAAAIIQQRETNRHFDTCFEMWDGDAVAAALYKRSLTNARLAANLHRYIVVDGARECYERYQGQNLCRVAASMRAKAAGRRTA